MDTPILMHNAGNEFGVMYVWLPQTGEMRRQTIAPGGFFRPPAAGVPWVIPGAGCVLSHLPDRGPRLRFAGTLDGQARQIRLWLQIPAGLPQVTLHAAGLDRQAAAAGWEDEAFRPLVWRCPRCAYMTAEIPTAGRDGLFILDLQVPEKSFRLTVAEGLPWLLDRPEGEFPYARIEVDVRTESGEPTDARVKFRLDGRLAAVADVLAGERALFHCPPCPAEFEAGQGIEYTPWSQALMLPARGELRLTPRLKRCLQPEAGWIWGDQHTHCYHNDGGQSPAANARAGRVNGLHYMFLSDDRAAFDDGFESCNQPGRFVGLFGQELTTPFTHCSLLNLPTDGPAVPYGVQAERYPDPADWLKELAAAQTQGHPCALQLNHPAHRPEVALRHGYFRSWWVADENPQAVRMVENFDFPSWYDRLSRGRRLTGLWTTDGHDAVWFPAGDCRIGLYTGGRIDAAAILEALAAGRAFCTRKPGALLYLTVNQALPGQTAESQNGFRARIQCQSTRPIQRIDLVQAEQVRHTLDGKGQLLIEQEVTLDRSAGNWVLAQLYAEDEGVPANGHCGNPLDVSGVLAFTNPVFLT